MPKRYELLDELKRCLENNTKPDNPECEGMGLTQIRDLFKEMKWYYKRKDLDLDTNTYYRLFTALYEENRIVVFDEIAYEFGMTTRTLDRRRLQFNEYFIKLKNLILHNR